MFYKFLRLDRLFAPPGEDARAISINRICATVLMAMLFLDLVFIAWGSVQEFKGPPRNQWNISLDGGIPEFFQYAKFTTLIFLFLIMFKARRSLVYLAFAVLFFYFLIDDSMMVHEILGEKLAQYFNFRPAFRLRPRDFGELLVTGIASIPLFGFLIISYLRESSKEVRNFSNVMFLLVVALAGFGIGVDMLDIMTPWPTVKMLLELIEDGGEMVVVTFMVAFALAAALAATQKQSRHGP